MKSIIAISAIVATTLAQAPPYFGVMSARSASPIHLLPLTARGGKFFLGGPGPSAYCPPQVGDACPPGNSTVLAGGYGGLSLGVIVPGGQQVYVAPDGTLGYTIAHSAYKPTGSVVDGWSRTEGDNFGNLAFTGGLYACPASEGNGYQVFGGIGGVVFDPACLGFNALTYNTTQAGAWQY
ncbi:hypothetical protein B0J11DRAFT_553446 [Dendryphion nanum]|uniref:IgE-binding protein n=1 Tax=Dendryphion nanum TaxID=256645 RepID=A0A9P9DA24_9PLEO|nr:hypothetical protein B0J11DRAFT_553446 [Dendryphion nanum]